MAEFEMIEDIEKLRALAPIATAPIQHHVFVCTGKSCSARESAEVRDAFESALKQRGILFGREAKGKNPKGSIVLTECASVGFCSIGPAVMVYPDGVWYGRLDVSDAASLADHLIDGTPYQAKRVDPPGE